MLASCYLIHGNDGQEIFALTTAVKEQARKQGYNASEVLEVTPQFAWETLCSTWQNLDLFSSKTLIEIRLTTETLDKNASAILAQFLEQQATDPNFCIIITAPKLKPTALNSSWVKFIQKHGSIQAGKALPPLFKLTNAASAGDIQQVIKLVETLKNSGDEPILVLWGLVREIKQLLHVKYAEQPPKYYQHSALARLSTTQLHDLLRFSSYVDSIIKGITLGNAWNMLLALYLSFTNPQHNPIPLEEIDICNKA